MSEVSPESNPEYGFLLRLRTWRDALPWLAIVDCLRPATSVVSLALVGLTVGVSIGVSALLDEVLPAAVPSVPAELPVVDDVPDRLEQAARIVFGPAMDLLRWPWGLGDCLSMLLRQWILLAIWAVPAAYLLRQCGLAMAGRSMMGTIEGLRLAARRFLALVAVPVLPVAILALATAYFAFVSLVGRIPAVGAPLEVFLQILGIPVAILAGLIGFAGLFALPLAWAAISLEQDGNSFDGLSRGYEYVLRRPLQGALYAGIAGAVLILLGRLADGVAHVAITVALSGSVIADGGIDPTFGTLTSVLALLPTVALLTVGWALVAWMYLLLRRSANHQEIEDVWESPRPKPEAFPEVSI